MNGSDLTMASSVSTSAYYAAPAPAPSGGVVPRIDVVRNIDGWRGQVAVADEIAWETGRAYKTAAKARRKAAEHLVEVFA